MLKLGKIYPQSSQLLLQNTVFGFIASGSVGMENEAEYHCGLIRNEDLNETLTKIWEREENEVKLKKINKMKFVKSILRLLIGGMKRLNMLFLCPSKIILRV